MMENQDLYADVSDDSDIGLSIIELDQTNTASPGNSEDGEANSEPYIGTSRDFADVDVQKTCSLHIPDSCNLDDGEGTCRSAKDDSDGGAFNQTAPVGSQLSAGGTNLGMISNGGLSQKSCAHGEREVSHYFSDGEACHPETGVKSCSAFSSSEHTHDQNKILAQLDTEPVSDAESGEEVGSVDESPGLLLSGVGCQGSDDALWHIPLSSHSHSSAHNAISKAVFDKDLRHQSQTAAVSHVVKVPDENVDLTGALDMESISDGEDIDDDEHGTDSSGEIVENHGSISLPKTDTAVVHEEAVEKERLSLDDKTNGEETVIASLDDDNAGQTNFTDEQVELDYEDVEGEKVNDGEIKTDSEGNVKEDGSVSEKDEGELDDDEDCEEGEIREPGLTIKPAQKSVCRFFVRGACTWGLNCRFVHPGVNDKGGYQMIELPGMRWPAPAIMGCMPWGKPPVNEPVDLPPPLPPDISKMESSWERGLRHAKEQIKKASQRKEMEVNFEEKRLNLSVEEEKELNKENEQRRACVQHPGMMQKDPYYDQAAYDIEEYYKHSRLAAWPAGHLENSGLAGYNRITLSPYKEKSFFHPVEDQFCRHISPPVDKFGRLSHDRPQPELVYRANCVKPNHRALSSSPPLLSAISPPYRRPDEWHDPWRRSVKSLRGSRHRYASPHSGRGHRSLSNSTISSNTRSSKSNSSRSQLSRTSLSSRSRSRSRSVERVTLAMEHAERNYDFPPGRFQRGGHRGSMSYRGRGRVNDGCRNFTNQLRGRGGYSAMRNFNQQQGPPARSFPPGYGYNRPVMHERSQERRLPIDALRPKGRQHGTTSSSRSRSVSRSSLSLSKSRSASLRSISSLSASRSMSSISSRTSTSSTNSTGSADSDNLYRDLGGVSSSPPSGRPVKEDRDVGMVATSRQPQNQSPAGARGGVPRLEHKRRVGEPVHQRHSQLLPAIPLPSGPPPPKAPGGHPPLPSRLDIELPQAPADNSATGRSFRQNALSNERVDPVEGRFTNAHVERPVARTASDRLIVKQDWALHADNITQHRGDRAVRSEKPDRQERLARPGCQGRNDHAGRRTPAGMVARSVRPARLDRDERLSGSDTLVSGVGGERILEDDRFNPNRSEWADMDRTQRERVERERGLAARPVHREQSSRPPPQAIPKAKDPMKLIGLKSNIKLSLVSKPAVEKLAPSPLVASPSKRHLPADDSDMVGMPRSKRLMLSGSPVKMASERVAGRVRSPSDHGVSALAVQAATTRPPSTLSPVSYHAVLNKGHMMSGGMFLSHISDMLPGGGAATVPAPVPPPAVNLNHLKPLSAGGLLAPAVNVSIAKVKKSTTARREELLKQLKAVEDAIARKKAKME